MYRDDLEAAQARADALEREAREQKDRAEAAEHEAAELRAKNAAWEAAAAQAKHEERDVVGTPPQRARTAPTGVTPARMRRSIIGWSLMAAGMLAMYLGGKLELGEGVFAIGLGVAVIGMILA